MIDYQPLSSFERTILSMEYLSGDIGEEVTPVPMPNTEVKLFSADGSWGISPCESRTSPGYSFHSSSVVELSAVNRSVAGSSPACGAIASIAQQVECFHGKEEVTGSSPVGSFLFF